MRATLLASLTAIAGSFAPQLFAVGVIEESAKLVLPDAYYPHATAVAVDGNFAVVGASFLPPSSNLWSNAAYVYERVGGTWVYHTTLSDVREENWRRVLINVAIEGNVVALALPREQEISVFERSGSTWTRTAVFDGFALGLDVGADIEIDNGTIFVAGSPKDGGTGARFAGAVLRKGTNGQWALAGRVVSTSDNGGGTEFVGGDVDLSGGTLAVASPFGAFMRDPVPGEISLFAEAGGSWPIAKVVADPTGQQPRTFADPIAIDAIALLGGSNLNNGVHVFPASSGWAYDRTLRSTDGLALETPFFMRHARSPLDTDGGIAVEAAPGDDARGVSSGSLRVYLTQPNRPTLPIYKLHALDSRPELRLGAAVRISGRTVIAGSSSNAAYVFELPAQIDPPPAQPQTLTEDFETGSGGNWTPVAGSSFSVVQSGTTRVYRQASLAGDAGTLLANTDWGNHGIQADITPTEFSGNDRWFGLAVRHSGPGNYYYVTLRSSNVIWLRRIVNGAVTTLASANLPVSLNKPYRVRLEAIGQWLKVSVDGKDVLQVRDSALTSGQAGILMYKTRADFDNVVVSASPALTMFGDDFESSNAAKWTPRGAGSWIVQPDGATQVYAQNSLAGTALSTTGVPTTTDQTVQVRAKALSFDGSDRWFGVIVGFQDEQNYSYLTVRNSNTVSLRRLVNGQIQVLDTAPLQVTAGTWFSLRLENVAGRLRGFVDGAPLVESAQPTVGGAYGVAMHRTSAVFDDFLAVQP